jgi:hypothetical protein
MKFKCMKCYREWNTSFRSIVQNIGCIKCSFKEIICLSMEDVIETIKDKNIECLDNEYVNSKIHMNWKCLVCKKSWKSSYDHIKHSNSGCPNCASKRSERLCRDIFEKILNKNFPTRRPKWLNGLELDGYNEELKLAFEYNGEQHEYYVPTFHKNGEEDFYKQQARDEEKRKLCKDNDVTLIEIPYEFNYKNEEKLINFISQKIKNH